MPSVRFVAFAAERRAAFEGSAKWARSFGVWISERRGSGGLQFRILGLKFWYRQLGPFIRRFHEMDLQDG